MTEQRLEQIREYREDTRSGDDLPDVKFAHEAIDCLLDEVERLRQPTVRVEVAAPTPPLPQQGGTPVAKGSITRLASTSLFDNTNPWVVTCGVCHSTEELGCGTLTLNTDLTKRGWQISARVGWVCPGCQKIMTPADNCWLTAENR